MTTSLVRPRHQRPLVAAAAIPSGAVFQLADGRAGVYTGLEGASLNDAANFTDWGQFVVPKSTGMNLLNGGPLYWNRANGAASFQRTSNRDYFLGTVVGDAQLNDATCTVNLNELPRYDLDLSRDPFTSVVVGTQAAGTLAGPYRRGGTNKLLLAATNEAEKTDALSDDGIVIGANAVVEMAINVVNGGAGGSQDFNVGLANGTHATDADAITQHLFLHLDGNATKINFQSKDGTNTTAATDSTLTFTAGTRFEVWFDVRNPAGVKIYVNAVQVLGGTTFNVSQANGVLKLLAHLEKTATTDVFEVDVNWLRARTAEQAV
jgi:predicted RecA/RadA family phage recombinase